MGTLNYYDDPTHKNDEPPNFEKILTILKNSDMEVIFSIKSYKPFLPYVIGALFELNSNKNQKVLYPWTWAYYGFEAIIWARKK